MIQAPHVNALGWLFAAVGVLLIQRGATEVLGQLAVGLLLTAYLVRNVKRLSQPNR